MARIYLPEISQAPQGGGGGVVSQSVQGLSTNIASVAQPLQQEQISAGAFDDTGTASIGKAVRGLGEIGSKVADTLQDAKIRMQRAADAGNLAKIDAVRTEAWAKFQAEKNPNTPELWDSQWKKANSDVEAQVKAYPLGEYGQQQLGIDTTNFNKSTTVDLVTGASVQTARNSHSAVMAQIDGYIDRGDYEHAAGLAGKNYDAGVLGAGEREAIGNRISQVQTQSTAASSVQQNAQQITEALVSKDEAKLRAFFPDEGKLSNQQMYTYANRAREVYTQQRVGVFQGWQELVNDASANGTTITPEQKQRFIDSAPFTLDATDLKKIDKTENATILNLPEYNTKGTEIANYDQRNDPTGTKAGALYESFTGFPKTYADQLKDKLDKKTSSGGSTPVLGAGRALIQKYGEDTDYFVPSNYDDLSSDDQTQARALGTAHQLDSFEAWQKEHPKATHEEAINYISAQVKSAQQVRDAENPKPVPTPHWYSGLITW